MSARISKLRKLAKATADLLVTGCSADEINPKFIPTLRWVPAERLESLKTLIVNVAPSSLTSTRLTRHSADNHLFIAIQVAEKITTAVQATIDYRVDELCALVEWMVEWLLSIDNVGVLDDAGNKYALKSVEVVDVFDWTLLEERRVFHSVLVLDYFHQQI